MDSDSLNEFQSRTDDHWYLKPRPRRLARCRRLRDRILEDCEAEGSVIPFGMVLEEIRKRLRFWALELLPKRLAELCQRCHPTGIPDVGCRFEAPVRVLDDRRLSAELNCNGKTAGCNIVTLLKTLHGKASSALGVLREWPVVDEEQRRLIKILAQWVDEGQFRSESFMTEPTRFWEVAPETWRLVIDTNVNGPFLMARAAAPQMMRQGWGRIINVSIGHETMRRKGFSPYGPSKAALESETIIWAQDLADTGITVNALLHGGATLTGMTPASFPAELRKGLLHPAVMVPPLLWLASERSDGITGQRFVASRWRAEMAEEEAIKAARENAGWPGT